jgi:PIN domain nuclease of toxin-antitoxin system
MIVLLDTHAFLWWAADDPNLSPLARSIIKDKGNQLYLSAASGWEIAIKSSTGKLALPDPPAVYVQSRMAANRVVELPVSMTHALQVHALPYHHKDPFDRLLVAQSQVESMPILTADPLIAQYAVTVLW